MKLKVISGIMLTLFIFCMLSVNMIGITVAQETHDIAVVSVTPSLTSVRVGELVNITVVVENKGTMPETFDVTVYYDSSTIKTETVTNLVAGASTSLTFTWNTTDVREEIYATDKKEKDYTINATASTVPDETDTEDNTLVSPSKVRVKSQYIAVIPRSTVDPNLTPGKDYTVSIYTDYNGSDVWGWQFELSYNPTVLEGIEVVNGDLITADKHPDAQFGAGDFDNSLGKLWLTYAFFYYTEKPIPTTYGPGILANVTFTVVGTGDSDITLVESKTKLTGYNATTEEFDEIVSDWKPGIGHILHGYFRNTVETVTHDVAILSVTPSTTTVTKGDLVNITVVVENQGTVPETITVAAYYNNIDPNYRIATTKTVQSLEAEASTSLTFVWDTTEVMEGDHNLIAVALPVFGEEDTEDNTLQSDEIVTVHVPIICPEYIALNATYHALLANFSNLIDDFDSLNSSYCELESSYGGLNSTYCDLFDTNSQLQSEFNDLKAKQDALTADLGTTRNLSYLFVATTIVSVATAAYLAIRKPKVKSD